MTISIENDISDLHLTPDLDDARLYYVQKARRSLTTPLALVIPLAMSWLAWMSADSPSLNDLAFVALTAICLIFAFTELRFFAQRNGLGALVLYAGVPVWYSHDYFSYWYGVDFGAQEFSAATCAKHTFLICLLTLGASYGLRITRGKRISRLILWLPEASNKNLYLVLAILLSFVGILPYFFFVAEPFYQGILKDMFAMRSGEGAAWTISRTGNLNYSGEAYWTRLLDVGNLGGILASMYAVWLTRSTLLRCIAWSIFGFWFMMGFGTGARSALLATALPALGFLYIRYQAEAAALFRKFSARAYTYTALAGIITLGFVQYQAIFRNSGTEDRTWQQVDLTSAQGNRMFTEGLLAVETVPRDVPFFRNSYFGQGAVVVLLDTATDFIIHPIPRALWTNKPYSAAWAWYNQATTGESDTGGTTIAPGLAAATYMGYGFGGVITFSIFFGWLLALIEMAFRLSIGAPVKMVFTLSLATFMMESFRAFIPGPFYTVVIGMVGLVVLLLLLRHLVPAPSVPSS